MLLHGRVFPHDLGLAHRRSTMNGAATCSGRRSTSVAGSSARCGLLGRRGFFHTRALALGRLVALHGGCLNGLSTRCRQRRSTVPTASLRFLSRARIYRRRRSLGRIDCLVQLAPKWMGQRARTVPSCKYSHGIHIFFSV